MSNSNNEVKNEVLVGTGRNGDFVHQGQVMGTDQGFKNVSQLWLDKTISIDDGLNFIETERSQRQDVKVKRKDMLVVAKNDGIKFTLLDGREFDVTDHASRQICNWFARTPQTLYNYLCEKPTNSKNKKVGCRDLSSWQVLADLLNINNKYENQDETLIIRTYAGTTMRALLSESYIAIDNAWYLNVIKEAMPDGRLSHWRGDADTIYGNVLIPDTIRFDTDSDYGGMISLSNCEIGKRRFIQTPSLFRAICMNGCIWDQKEGNSLNKVHRGKSFDLNDLRDRIFKNIHEQIPLVDDIIKKFLAKKELQFKCDVRNVIAAICKTHSIGSGVGSSKGEISSVLNMYNKFEGANQNLFGVLNAVTRTSQTLSPERQYDLDIVGGELFNYDEKKWDNVLNKAKSYTADDLEELFV